MKILCVNYEYPPIGGGGSAVCRDLAERLVGFGHDIDLVTSGFKGLKSREDVAGVRIHRVPCIRRHGHYVSTPEMATLLWPAYRRSRELLARHEHAVNHTHFIVPSGLISYFLRRTTGLPYVVTVHGSDVPGYNPDRFNLAHRMIRPIWRQVVKNAACVVTPSNHIKRLLNESVDVDTETIPNGVDFPIRPECSRKMNRILVVTRMFERKGVQYFLEAIRDLRTDWEVFVAGDGPYLSRLKEMARGIAPKISFLGFIRGNTLTDLYHSAKLFVFPSTQENFPMVLLEAMSAGCAVITTSAFGCAEVVEDAAVKVAPANVFELKQAVERMIHDEGEITRLSHLAQQRAELFRSEGVARRYEQLFERIAS